MATANRSGGNRDGDAADNPTGGAIQDQAVLGSTGGNAGEPERDQPVIPTANLSDIPVATPNDSESEDAEEAAPETGAIESMEFGTAMDRTLKIPAGTDAATVAAIKAVLKSQAESKPDDVMTDKEIVKAFRKAQKESGITAEPKGALEQMAAAEIEEMQRSRDALDAEIARRSGLRRADAGLSGQLGREQFTDDLRSATPEQYRINPFAAQPFMPVNAHDVRLAMQAEADQLARKINASDRPGAGVYGIPVLNSQGDLLRYEYKDGNGNPMSKPAGAE